MTDPSVSSPDAKAEFSGFAFCTTDIRPIGELPAALTRDHEFRAATPDEQSHIRECLQSTLRGTSANHPIIYECAMRRVPCNSGYHVHFDHLPPKQWRYFGIGYVGNNAQIPYLQVAANLVSPSLTFGVTLFVRNGSHAGISYNIAELQERISGLGLHKETQDVPISEIAKIGTYFHKIQSLPEDATFVKGSVESFFVLHAILQFVPLKVVGLFSIIESLVTHKPRLNESLDSISHQVRHKLVLLEKKFNRPAPYNEQFEDIDHEKVWKLLYGYRSAIAHGDRPGFDKEFRPLRSNKNVVDFLTFVVKELLVFSLDNYGFLADLKEC